MDRIELLIDPQATPADELRRFRQYVQDNKAALATAETDLECLLDMTDSVNEVDRFNRAHDVMLQRRRVEALRNAVSVQSRHLQTVRCGFAPRRSGAAQG